MKNPWEAECIWEITSNLLRETKILQIPFTSQQVQIFQKNMKQFIWTYGRRNIITNPRLKYRMLKFQFMTIRTNVTGDTTKVTNKNKFRDISILTTNLVSDFGFCLSKEQFGLIWPTTPQRWQVGTKTNFLCNLSVGLGLGLETSTSKSELYLCLT